MNALVFSLQPVNPRLPPDVAEGITDFANRYDLMLKVVGLVGLGLCIAARRSVRDWPSFFIALGAIVYFTAVHSLMPAWDRYRFPIMPFWTVLAACVPGAIIALAQTRVRLRYNRAR